MSIGFESRCRAPSGTGQAKPAWGLRVRGGSAELLDDTPGTPARPRSWFGWRSLVALLLGGYLLFAHGCHGDEDNELFAAATAAPAGIQR